MQQIECSFIIYCSLPFGTGASLVTLVKSPLATTGDAGSIPGSGRSPGEGNGNPLQYSCLENSIDKGDWWATGHRVTKELDTTEHAHTHTHTHTHLQNQAGPLSLWVITELGVQQALDKAPRGQVSNPMVFRNISIMPERQKLL